MTDSFDGLTVRVYYEDTDASGVVYHANYLKYCERARTQWLAAQGLGHQELAMRYGVAFTLADARIAFRAPARLDDMLHVGVEIAEHRRARIVFAQEITCGARRLIQAKFTVACVNMTDFRPRGLPAALLGNLGEA